MGTVGGLKNFCAQDPRYLDAINKGVFGVVHAHKHDSDRLAVESSKLGDWARTCALFSHEELNALEYWIFRDGMKR